MPAGSYKIRVPLCDHVPHKLAVQRMRCNPTDPDRQHFAHSTNTKRCCLHCYAARRPQWSQHHQKPEQSHAGATDTPRNIQTKHTGSAVPHAVTQFLNIPNTPLQAVCKHKETSTTDLCRSDSTPTSALTVAIGTPPAHKAGGKSCVDTHTTHPLTRLLGRWDQCRHGTAEHIRQQQAGRQLAR